MDSSNKNLKARRSPLVLAAGVVFVVVGLLAAFFLVQTLGKTEQALAVRKDLPAGHVLAADDFVSVDVPQDTNLPVVAPKRVSDVAGLTLSVPVYAGALFDERSVASDYGFNGRELVSVFLPQERVPSWSLSPGQGVRLILVADDLGSGTVNTRAVSAEVVSSVSVGGEMSSTTGLKVDVLVSPVDAVDVAAASVAGKVAVSVVQGGMN